MIRRPKCQPKLPAFELVLDPTRMMALHHLIGYMLDAEAKHYFEEDPRGRRRHIFNDVRILANAMPATRALLAAMVADLDE